MTQNDTGGENTPENEDGDEDMTIEEAIEASIENYQHALQKRKKELEELKKDEEKENHN